MPQEARGTRSERHDAGSQKDREKNNKDNGPKGGGGASTGRATNTSKRSGRPTSVRGGGGASTGRATDDRHGLSNSGGNDNRPKGAFQSPRYSSLTPNGELPSTGVTQGIADLIGSIMDDDAYGKYGEPDLSPKDITPQDVDALGSNLGSTGAGQDRIRSGSTWLDAARSGGVTRLPDAPALTLDDYLNELRTKYIDPNSRYYLEQRGLIDPSAPAGIPEEWAPYFEREFNRIRNTLPGDLIGPDSKEADVFNQLRNYFSDQFGKNALDAEELRRRNDFTTQLNQKGFRDQLSNAFGDTADDDIINSIINPQYQSAQDLFTNQMKRGTLTNTGYNYAMQALGEQRNAANSKLQEIGAGQRAAAMGGVEDYLDEIYNKAGGYKLGETFDPNSFDTEFGNRLTSAQSGLEGKIRGAAPSNLFDTPTVLSNAGTAQGQSSRGSLLDTLANRRSRTQSRGLGTTGAF
jgi:hypothetical protein